MPPVYAYQCKQCGAEVEVDRILSDDTRHLIEDKVCGTLRRVWSANFNRVPGGARD